MKNRKTLKHIITIMILMFMLATVSACGGGGGGGGGGSVITPDPDPVYTAPSAVTNLNIEYGNKFGEMILSWTGPVNVGSSALQSYDVRYSNDNNSFNSINFSPVTPIPAGRTESVTINALSNGNVINYSSNPAIKPGCNLQWSVISRNSNPSNSNSSVSNVASKKLPWRSKIKVSCTKGGISYFYETFFGVQGNAVDNSYDSKFGFDSPLPNDPSSQSFCAYFEEKVGFSLTSSIHSSATAKKWRLVVAGTALADGDEIKIEFPDYGSYGPVYSMNFVETTNGSGDPAVIPSNISSANYTIGVNGNATFEIYGGND